MSNKNLEITNIQLRHDSASAWVSANPVLLSGEFGIEIDTRKFKIGDGSTAWNELKYASGGMLIERPLAPTASDVNYEIATTWIDTTTNGIYYLVAKASGAVWARLATFEDIKVVDEAIVAQRLKTARTLAVTGDGTASASFDGSENVTLNLLLKNSGVSAGTYTKLTVDAKGIVTGSAQLTEADIPELHLSKIADAGTAASHDVGVGAGQLPVLDTEGKLPASVIGSYFVSDIAEVASEAEMLALTDFEKGDVAVRSDENKTYILKQAPASNINNWVLLRTPTDVVLSVNGQTGAVTLTTSNIAEGSNLYFTTQRAEAVFDTKFSATSVVDLADGEDVVKATDSIRINCGGA